MRSRETRCGKQAIGTATAILMRMICCLRSRRGATRQPLALSMLWSRRVEAGMHNNHQVRRLSQFNSPALLARPSIESTSIPSTAVAISILLSSLTGLAADRFPAQSLPGVVIGTGLGPGYEASGTVWHQGIERIFAVSDNGRISQMDTQGGDVQHWTVFGEDLEGITIADPSSNFVYAVNEVRKTVIEFDFVNGHVARRFNLQPWTTARGTVVLKR